MYSCCTYVTNNMANAYANKNEVSRVLSSVFPSSFGSPLISAKNEKKLNTKNHSKKILLKFICFPCVFPNDNKTKKAFNRSC